jgi:hypothetical protein
VAYASTVAAASLTGAGRQNDAARAAAAVAQWCLHTGAGRPQVEPSCVRRAVRYLRASSEL